MDRSQDNTPNVNSHLADQTQSISLRHHPSSVTISYPPDSPEANSISTSDPMRGIESQHQTFGLRAKKYIIPRILSNRKIALSALHPLSAALMNDIHYLLKAHITPKERFKQMDHIILRTVIKVGTVSQYLLEQPHAVALMRHVEHLSRKFGRTYCDIVTQTEEAISSPASSCSSASPAKSPSSDFTLLLNTLKKLQDSLDSLTQGHLSENSIAQMDAVFEELQDPSLWQRIFDHANSTPEEWILVLNLRHSFRNIILANML
ncbi:hypothetical protein Aperf_G00000070764 [Anoplocephala perfoliata]